ncbi:MAG TPA: PAS and ANTAR domain-containing protein [Mycobacterium sp.]|nr:PAS and ANTAR domain-containing protein [Mycobacterium sp.]
MVIDGLGTPAPEQPDDDTAERSDLEPGAGRGEPDGVGWFRFFLDGQRWEWSDTVARMHGYRPGTVDPTSDLLLQHKHPDDRQQVEKVLERVRNGEPFSSRHRIIDTEGRTHWVIAVGDRMRDATGAVIGTSGFYADVTDARWTDGGAATSRVDRARAVIEQAKGLLMVGYDISAERAFDILVWRSQEANIKVRDLADRLLSAFAGRLPSEVVTELDHTLLTLD